MTSDAPLLDLRDRPTRDLRLTRPTATGTAGGYTLHAQRRSHDGHLGLCLRLATPDGHHLDLVAPLSRATTSAQQPVGATLSADVGRVFRERRTPAQEDAAAAALAAGCSLVAVFLAATAVRGPQASFRLQVAAHRLDEAVLVEWPAPETPAAEDLRLWPWDWAKGVAFLRQHGFTPASARDWGVRANTPVAEVRAKAAFAAAGWTLPDYRDLFFCLDAEAENPRVTASPSFVVPTSWARLTLDQALLACRAGLNAREAHRLVTRGDWDCRALETLAALRT